jgi:predicted RNA-binding Zn-ribbon protein involved in translation (DUF1610 family)
VMAVIRSKCPTCGDVDMSSDAVSLTADHRHYVYVCPVCGRGVVKKAGAPAVRMLLDAGVVTLGVTAEEHNPDAVKAPGAPAITYDDLIDFHANIDAELERMFEGR